MSQRGEKHANFLKIVILYWLSFGLYYMNRFHDKWCFFFFFFKDVLINQICGQMHL